MTKPNGILLSQTENVNGDDLSRLSGGFHELRMGRRFPMPHHPLFSLGKIVGTPGALAALERNGENPFKFLARHQAGDWGEIDDHDRAENETSLEHGFRLLSAYALVDGTRTWVITEADRSSTCILLPEEY